jgi:CBS domain-containing protein
MIKIARDLMTRDVIVVNENMVIHSLIDLFLEKKISSAPVVNEENNLIGIVTKTDILGSFLDLDLDLTVKFGLKDILEYSQEHSDLKISAEKEKKVKDIMTVDPITVSEDTPAEKLAEIMIDNNIHRLIVTKGSAITGIVSTLDLIYYVAGKNKYE